MLCRNILVSVFFTISCMMANAVTQSATPHGGNRTEIVFTTDVHGNFFPYDFIRLKKSDGSLARVASAVDSLREKFGKNNVVLLDNGDILQGQPTVYYYNFIDTVSTHIAADIYDFMEYDAATVGNHDIETGHPVYDRVRSQCGIPVLAANVIDTATGQPYFTPYTIIRRDGLKIAVLGLLTPAIPAWLPERLWAGMRFEPMQETAEKWIKVIRETENPDLVIGLFHSGHDSSKTTGGFIENASLDIARNVDGFDAVFMGHDHVEFMDTITNRFGHTVHVLNPANNAMNIGVLTVEKTPGGKLNLRSRIEDIRSCPPSPEFMKKFGDRAGDVKKFVEKRIGSLSDSIYSRDAFFGPSAFMTLIHNLQKLISRAEISMAAPLTSDGVIAAGPLKVADMFTLYKYENTLCTLRLTGKEIKDYLEYSYNLWIDTPSDSCHHIIKFESQSPTAAANRLKNPSYNFDSASGITYTVNIGKPFGERIDITATADGKPFELDRTYTVALNSYRAGGGGNHLTEGAGIAPDELTGRIVSSTDKDLRYYLMKIVESSGTIEAAVETNWRFIPEKEADEAIAVDRELLFGRSSSKNQK